MSPAPDPPVTVSVFADGNPAYFAAAREAVLSVLVHTDFAVRLACTPGPALRLPRSPRLATEELEAPTRGGPRARPFLRKLAVLRDCLRTARSELLVHLDADALVVDRIDADAIAAALADRGLALAEQGPLGGSGTDVSGYHAHFVAHTIPWIDADARPPEAGSFRYFNSGVVLGTRRGWSEFLEWALETVERTGPDHRVGEHMIGDQDYFQFWAHCRVPGSVTPLPWQWNHCEHWDPGFPRRDAKVAHFSTFCVGPGRRELLRMRLLRAATRPASPLAPVGRSVVRLLRRRA